MHANLFGAVAIALQLASGAAQAGTPMHGNADALLAIDQHRASVVDRVVTQWGEPLAQSGAGLNADQLREMLGGLRADHLLAASLAGTLDGLRNVLALAVASAAPPHNGLMPAKAL